MRVPSGAVVLAVAAVLLAAAAVFVLPETLVPSSAKLTDAERYGLENSVRTTLLQAIGGALLLAGAFFTWRQVLISQRQLDVARQGQVTERFTRAIDQLGSETVDVRLGGIYALEGLANTSEEQRIQVIEILAAFVRVHAPLRASSEPPPAEQQAGGSLVDTADHSGWLPMRQRAPDAQTALRVLGRLLKDGDPAVQLSDTDLEASDLSELYLGKVVIGRGRLRDADIRGTSLVGARLSWSDLSGVAAVGADLRRATLQGVLLRRANLARCNLRDADLRHADLTGAVLGGANLAGANLEGAALDRADLRGVDLAGAVGLVPGQTERAFTDDGPVLPEGTVERARALMARARTLAIAAPSASESVLELSRLLDGDRLAGELAVVDCIKDDDALRGRRHAVRLLIRAMAEGATKVPHLHSQDRQQQA